MTDELSPRDPLRSLASLPEAEDPSPEFLASLRARLADAIVSDDAVPGGAPESVHAAPEPVVVRPHHFRRRRRLLVAAGLAGALIALALIAGSRRGRVDVVDAPTIPTTVPVATTGAPPPTTLPSTTATTAPRSTLTSAVAASFAPPLVALDAIRPGVGFVAMPVPAVPELPCVSLTGAELLAAGAARPGGGEIAPEHIQQWVFAFSTAEEAAAVLDALRTLDACGPAALTLPNDAIVYRIAYTVAEPSAAGVVVSIAGSPYSDAQAVGFGDLRGQVARLQAVADGRFLWLMLNDEAVGGTGPSAYDTAAVAAAAGAQLQQLTD